MARAQEPAPGRLLADAVEMAKMAGDILRHGHAGAFEVEHKGAIDLVTGVDRASQELLEREIRRRHPGHGILGEEGLDDPGDAGFLWVLDPLDGTTNFVHRFPVFAVSIGVYRGDEALAGVVYNPVAEELFTAAAGEGAFLNRLPIRVSAVADLEGALVGTGFPYNIRERGDDNLAPFSRMALRVQGVRRCGSASLDLCYVACGRFDGFWEFSLRSWDIAAGSLILREAGGRVTDFAGNDLVLDGSRTLASNGLIHQALMAMMGTVFGS
jgi:myo-inositol-1(or 4)-monophosphatase